MQESINNQSMLKVGTILRGIYRIDSYLSSGGFGNTYVATNIEFDERVAIKEFFMKGVTQRDDNQTTVSVSNSENTNSFLEQKEKFKKEARRIRQLKNEHIVSVHDLFEENGTAYYVMDYVDGENLSDRLKRKGRPMTEFEVNLILPQVLDALKAIHDADIWHLDLKPANIMVDKRGRVKLIDFGASKQLNVQKGGATTTTAISYTNGYAPREQMEQNYDKFGPWTDIYALGATLYNLLTNKRPPLPTDIDDDMSEDKHVALPFPENVGGLKFLVHQMMKTNRLQRPQSIDAIISAEKPRKENLKQAPKQDTMSEKTMVYNDETTIIADPKPQKKSEFEPEYKGYSQFTQSSYTHVPQDGINWLKKRWVIIILGICIITGIFLAIYGELSNSTQETNQQNVESNEPKVVYEEQKPNVETPQLSLFEKKIVGNHLFSLQWIESKYYGTCEIKKEGETLKCVALHESDNKKDYLKMEGDITIVSDNHLRFTGTILRKVHYLYNGKEYRRSGTFDFKAWGTRKYWRGQDMNTPDGYDYIDIFFEKYE